MCDKKHPHTRTYTQCAASQACVLRNVFVVDVHPSPRLVCLASHSHIPVTSSDESFLFASKSGHDERD